MADKLFTKAQAAKKAGISVRSLERYTTQGKIAVGYRTTTRGKEAVYAPEDVERLRDDLKVKSGVVIVPAEIRETPRQAFGEKVAPVGEALARTETQSLFERLAEVLASRVLPQAEGPPSPRTALSIGDKLALTIPEAASLVGSSAHRIRAAIHSGELHAMKDSLGRGWRIRRSDLEEWLASL